MISVEAVGDKRTHWQAGIACNAVAADLSFHNLLHHLRKGKPLQDILHQAVKCKASGTTPATRLGLPSNNIIIRSLDSSNVVSLQIVFVLGSPNA